MTTPTSYYIAKLQVVEAKQLQQKETERDERTE